MRCKSLHLSAEQLSDADVAPLAALDPHLLIVFASPTACRHAGLLPRLRRACGGATLIGCSTAGEIGRGIITDQGLVVAAVRMEHPRFRVVSVPTQGRAHSARTGQMLARQLAAPDLRAVMMFAPDVELDGVALTEALIAQVGDAVTVFGGLAGDGSYLTDGLAAGLGAHLHVDRQGQSWTLLDDRVSDRHVVAVAWYGEHTRVGHGMQGGAQPFGPLRRATRAEGCLLLELDGQPALDIYRRYLGRYADELPASGLMFPFAMLDAQHGDRGLIRTLVDIDEARHGLVLAGAVREGDMLRLMQANTANLTRGAQAAAEQACRSFDGMAPPGLALAVSCADRKMVMGNRVLDEVEAIDDALPPDTPLMGFYANAEIGRPRDADRACLNNQTMTVTCLYQ